MRLRCHLREIRGPRTLRALADTAGLSPSLLSRIENGIMLPPDKDIPALEAAYGAMVTDWYPKATLLALEFDEDELEAIRARLHITLTGIARGPGTVAASVNWLASMPGWLATGPQ